METTGGINRTISPRDWALIALLSIIWGGSFFFIGVAVKGLPPLTIVGLRLGIAALTLHGIVRATGQHLPFNREVWRAFLGMGFLNNLLPFCLIVWGQTRIASSLASILNATTPRAFIPPLDMPAGVWFQTHQTARRNERLKTQVSIDPVALSISEILSLNSTGSAALRFSR
jgi:hypothetical protein